MNKEFDVKLNDSTFKVSTGVTIRTVSSYYQQRRYPIVDMYLTKHIKTDSTNNSKD